MAAITSSPNEALTISLKLPSCSVVANLTVRNMIPSHDCILSSIQCKSQQIILEGIEYE